MARCPANQSISVTGGQTGIIAGLESRETRRDEVRRVRQDLARHDRARRARVAHERGLREAPKTWRTGVAGLLRHCLFHLQVGWDIDRRC